MRRKEHITAHDRAVDRRNLEHARHGHHSSHHSKHHSAHHSSHHDGHQGHMDGGHMYMNEVEKPHVPMHGHQEEGMGCHDFKGEAMNIAYGQAGESGCASDNHKIESQMKHYHWEGSSEY